MTLPSDSEQDAIDRAASVWLVRVEEDGLDADGERVFEQWLAADPRHQDTYASMRQTWFDIAAVPGLTELAPVKTQIESKAAAQRLPAASRWAGGVVAAGALAASFFFLVGRPPVPPPEYRTALAQTREVSLPDGSRAVVGAHSSITIAYSAAERRVILSSGEALFDVIHDVDRPFVVDAGTSVIRDIGTVFNVNRTANSVRVGVISGRVQVRSGDNAATVVTLGRGQGAQVFPGPSSNTSGLPTPSSDIIVAPQQAPGAWRDGRLVFDNVRLADLSADVNRYYAPGMLLGSPAVGALRVTASFKISEIPAFVGALDATLPVRTERSPDGAFRIVEASR